MVQISVENSKQIWNILSEGATKILPPSPLLSKDEELRDIDHIMKIGNLILCVSSVSFHIWFIMTVYYKMRQICDSYFTTKCDRRLLQNTSGFLLENTTVTTNCNNFITKCDSYYKIRRLLQIATVQVRREVTLV